MSLLKSAFGNNLKLIRKSKGLTQEQLAELVGLNQRQLTRIETGVSFLSADVLEKLSIALNVNLKDLFDFELSQISISATGTDAMPYFKVSQTENVFKIQQFTSTKTKDKISERTFVEEAPDKYFLQTAKDKNEAINVRHFDKGALTKTYIYHPDGKIELIQNKEISDKSKAIEQMLAQIKKISNNDNQFDYVKLAMDSLNNPASRKKLKTLIEGMELLQ